VFYIKSRKEDGVGKEKNKVSRITQLEEIPEAVK
jgi:hypothetical protein